MRTFRTIALVAAVPLLLAVVGLFHPHALDGSTAGLWQRMHIALLPVFPLLAAGFLVPLWGRPRRDIAGFATVIAWACAFLYAAFYTGLDAVAGIAAGTAARHAGADTALGPLVRPLFGTGDALGRAGAYAFIAAVLAASVALLVRHGARTIPGAVILLAAGYSFIDSHIFWPRGVFTMLGFALGFSLLGWAASSSPAPIPEPSAARPSVAP